MSEELLTSVRLVCCSDPRVAALPHVGELIDAFRFSTDGWTLERASKRGFVSKLDRIRQNEPRHGREFDDTRFYSAVHVAVKDGYDIRVLQWWLDTYVPKENENRPVLHRFRRLGGRRSREHALSTIVTYSIRFKRLDVLKWLYEETQGELSQDHGYNTMACSSDPEVTYWLYEHGRNLSVTLPMYECSAADPSFAFAKWCLTQQGVFTCDSPEEAVSFAIDHGQEEYLLWLYEHRLDLFQPHHLDRAISKGRLSMAQWLLNKFPKQFFSDPSQALDTTAFEFGYDHLLKLIQWVVFELEWQVEEAKEAWMEGVMVAIAGAGNTELLDAVKMEFHVLLNVSNSRLTSVLMDAAASNGRLKMIQWLHKHDHDRTIVRWIRDAWFGPKYIDKAAANGHLDVVIWLQGNRYKGCTTDAMDHAAANGYLSVVEWLYANRREGCTTKAMHLAAKNGHLQIVQWLHENRKEGCERSTLVCAAGSGHLRVVQFLYLHRPECCQELTPVKIRASDNSDLEMYEWVDENITEEERMKYRKCRQRH